MGLLYYLANVTARSLGLAAVADLGVWLFHVKQPAARHAALSLVTGGMLLLAGLTAVLPAIPVRVLRAERAAAMTAPATVIWTEPAVPTGPVTSHPVVEKPRLRAWAADLSWPVVASAVYLGAALILLLRLAYGYLFTRRLVRASRPDGDIYESPWISVPMTVGWLKPKILLPVLWKEWDAAKLAAVLAHERMHIARADWAIAALAAVNRCVFWFNPLAWWMERKLATLAEQACDDAALLETGAREPYAEALLDMAAAVRTGRGRMVWEAMAMARTAEVKKRIERILDESREIPRGLTRGRWAALLACSLPVMVMMAAGRLAPAQDVPPAPQLHYPSPTQAAQPVARAAVAQAAPAAATPEQAPATPAQASDQPRSILLYFDFVAMPAYVQVRARDVGRQFIESQLVASDKVAIVANTGTMKVLQEFTNDRDRLLQVVRDLPETNGGVASFLSADRFQQSTAVESAVRLLDPLTGKKALVYFCDHTGPHGFDASPQLKSVVDEAAQANVAFYPLPVSGAAGRGQVFVFRPGFFERPQAPAQAQEQPRTGEIRYAERRMLVLYFDLQGMSPEDEVRAQSRAQTYLDSQAADNLVAVMAYAGEAKVLQDFTDNRGLLAQAIRSLPAGSVPADSGYSALDRDRHLASLADALKLLGVFPQKKAIIYFGSGLPRTDDGHLRVLIDTALQANVAFFPVDVSGQGAAQPEQAAPSETPKNSAPSPPPEAQAPGAPGKYYMSGRVKSPGEHELIGPTTVLQALISAGGFTDFANEKNVTIVRGDKRFLFNFKEVMAGKNLEQNVYLESGDMIVVK